MDGHMPHFIRKRHQVALENMIHVVFDKAYRLCLSELPLKLLSKLSLSTSGGAEGENPSGGLLLFEMCLNLFDDKLANNHF
ncbi:hypothetical protein AMTR_s00168p00030000 [Amborella trichopoda]|uniref:Uncharacterized protein n=1 Tax=Amborella trichopoda TaxID=13333 RepID=W1PR44_AMBTC|nr:hypothetical protein AMTR_s00168p00030000 [Amborella trichopoda]